MWLHSTAMVQMCSKRWLSTSILLLEVSRLSPKTELRSHPPEQGRLARKFTSLLLPVTLFPGASVPDYYKSALLSLTTVFKRLKKKLRRLKPLKPNQEGKRINGHFKNHCQNNATSQTLGTFIILLRSLKSWTIFKSSVVTHYLFVNW